MNGGGSLRSPGAALGAAGRALRARGARCARGARRGGAGMVAMVSFGLLPASLPAQAPVPERLGLEDAVRVALERNPAFLQQLNAVERAEYSERSAWGGFLPSLSASMGFRGDFSRSLNAVDEFGRPVGGQEYSEYTRSSASQGLSGQYTLLDLRQIAEYRAARANTAMQVAAVDAQAATVRRQVGQAYWAAVRQARLLGVEERQLETARENLSAVRELLRLAARQPTDVLGAELDVAQAELNVLQARGEVEKAELALKQAIGTSMATRFILTDDFPAVFDPAALDDAALLDRAVRENPRLAQQEAAVEAADRSLSATRALRYPSIGGSYSYGRGTNALGYDAIGRFDLPNSGWGFGISLSLPLFNGFQTSGQIGQAAIEAENAREALRQERLTLEQEVLSARIDLENAYAGVRVAERSVEIARQRLAQGQELYRSGTLDFTALQQMINALAGAERGLVNAQTQFANALLVLEEKVGGPVRP